MVFIFVLSIFNFSCINICNNPFVFFPINWARYSNDNAYWYKVNHILQYGIIRIKGQETQIHSVFLLTLFGIGFVVSLVVFLLAWSSYRARTKVPLIAGVGFLLPMIPFGINTLIPVVFGSILILFGGIFSLSELKLL